MNKHILLDNLTAIIASISSGKNKFFSKSIDSQSYSEYLQNINLEIPAVKEGIHEIVADTPAGKLDTAFYVAQLKGKEYPIVIYHHGNNERPFDFSRFAKNTFKNIFIDSPQPIDANIIAIRAPFHDLSVKEYQKKVSYLSNFTAMLSVSVKLINELILKLKKEYPLPVMVSGISLGGWITNLHRTYFNSADMYVPLLAGAALGDLFTDSIYRKMTGTPARENPDAVRKVLNFESDFKKIEDDNVFPLLGRFDQFIQYERQKKCYGQRSINVLEKGHVTSALAADALRQHILTCLKR